MAALSPEIAEFLESGVIMYLASRDHDLVPEAIMALGARVAPSGDELIVFVPGCSARLTLANLEDNGQMALTVVRTINNRSIQIKGTLIQARPSTEDDQAYQRRYLALLSSDLALEGVPPSVSARFVYRPGVALQMRVRDIYTQTPGPGAGRRLDEGGL